MEFFLSNYVWNIDKKGEYSQDYLTVSFLKNIFQFHFRLFKLIILNALPRIINFLIVFRFSHENHRIILLLANKCAKLSPIEPFSNITTVRSKKKKKGGAVSDTRAPAVSISRKEIEGRQR